MDPTSRHSALARRRPLRRLLALCVLAIAAPAQADVFINELHYDECGVGDSLARVYDGRAFDEAAWLAELQAEESMPLEQLFGYVSILPIVAGIVMLLLAKKFTAMQHGIK